MYDWIISDTHFNHENIVKFAGRPVEHNELIQQNWRELVRPHDTVLHLGDVLFGKRELWPSMPGWLPGSVLVVKGNHDHEHKVKFMEENWHWTFTDQLHFDYRGWHIIFSHYPWGTMLRPGSTDNTDMVVQYMLPSKTLNVHGHMHDRPSPSLYHLNVCVEWMGYSPQRLEDILDTKIDELEET